jgi:glycerol-1-phosphate dehydrogenase [NAD(P)+]
MSNRLFITTPEVWQRYGVRYAGLADRVEFVDSTAREEVSRRFDQLEASEVYGLGGGQAIDIAKYVGARRGCRVIAIPAIVSVDAFLVSDSAVREGGRVVYLPTKKPDEIRIEPDIILSAPPRMNSAGWGDVLSIITAVWDWRAAHEDIGESYDDDIAQQALALLERARRVDNEQAIDALVSALRAEVELCEKWGSARPEEGSEHFFVYTLENHLPADGKFLHGELVGLGISLMAEWQGQDVGRITSLMDRAGLVWRAGDIGVPDEAIAAALAELPDRAAQYGYWYSVINRRQKRN